MRKNFVPPKDGKFLEWVKNFFNYMVLNAAMWRIEPESWRELEELTVKYETAYIKLEDPNHGRADVLLKTECRNALEKEVRAFVREYVANNHLVTDENRIHLGVTVRDPKPSPAPVCDKAPLVTTIALSVGLIQIKFGNVDTGKRGKPLGQTGAELIYAILDHKPEDWKELTHSIFSTRSPFHLPFEGTERGKIMYFALRWQNTRGEKCPWTEIMSVVIP
jgi:hypothetical protein